MWYAINLMIAKASEKLLQLLEIDSERIGYSAWVLLEFERRNLRFLDLLFGGGTQNSS